jgi:hypothetical protein
MPHSKRWTAEDIAELKRLAGTVPAQRIAEKLGRSRAATFVEASKLKLSLKTRSTSGVAKPTGTKFHPTGHA